MVEPLPKNQFFNVIRTVMRASIDDVTWLQTVTYNTLRRLNVGRDISKCATRVPNGSNHVELGSVRDWMAKVGSEDTKAIEQIVAIDATCTTRTGKRI